MKKHQEIEAVREAVTKLRDLLDSTFGDEGLVLATLSTCLSARVARVARDPEHLNSCIRLVQQNLEQNARDFFEKTALMDALKL